MNAGKLLLFSCLVAAVVSSELRASRTRLEPDSIVNAHGWTRVERADPRQNVTVILALAHEPVALKTLDDLFHQCSDPSSSLYGRHLSLSQVNDVLSIPESRLSKVLEWLRGSENADSLQLQVVSSREYVSVSGHVHVIEDLFQTELHVFCQEADTTSCAVRVGVAQGYSVPADIAPDVDLVIGLVGNLVSPRSKAMRSSGKPRSPVVSGPQSSSWWNDCAQDSVGFQCQGWITPGVLRQRYGVPNNTATLQGSVAVAEFEDAYFDSKDLSVFSETCGLSPPITVTRQATGINDPSVCTTGGGCQESLMDIQYLGAVAVGVPLTVYYHQTYSIWDWILAVSQDDQAPLVHSVSYGTDEVSNSAANMARANVEFQKMGVRGLSIVVAAGDAGVWGNSGNTGDVFHPLFPASSPYVTSVGGTHFVKSGVIGEEGTTVWSGGGFSNQFPMPTYQKQAVSAYLQSSNLPPQKYWNASGRAYPDISALCGSGAPYCVLLAGEFQAQDGTSASTPVIAGVLARVNAVRVQKGLSALGFVNPALYSGGSALFHDVTSGSNGGSYGSGFEAGVGWDAAAGWGTPDFAAMVERLG